MAVTIGAKLSVQIGTTDDSDEARYAAPIDDLFAERVLIARSVLEDDACRARLDRILARVRAGTTDVVSDDALEEELRSLGRRVDLPRAGLEGRRRAKKVIAFSRLGDREEVFPGYSWRELRNGGDQRRENGVLCHTAIEIQSAVGCTFDCSYCPYTPFVAVRLDIETFVERVAQLTRERPSQTLYKLNNRTDTLGLEPELGLAGALVERFATLGGAYLMLYSKGDEVDSLCELDHRGKTVGSFTLTPEPIAQLLETGAPAPAARIAAMGKLFAAGYPVRARLSPVVPLRGWREAYDELLERMFAAATPEMITLWTLSMIEMDELDQIVPTELFDQDVLAACRSRAEEMRGQKGAPIPPDVRAAIYQHIAMRVRELSPTTRVSLCLETEDVWSAIAPVLVPRSGGDFLCNCGPRVTPEAIVQLSKRRRPER